MSTLDYIILFTTAYFVFKGVYHGLIKELFSLLAVLLGVLVAYYFSDYFSDQVSTLLPEFTLSKPILAIILFIVTALIVKQIGNLLTRVSKFVALGFFNRVLGGLFGAFKAGIILVFLLYCYQLSIETVGIDETEFVNESSLVPYLNPILTSIKQTIHL